MDFRLNIQPGNFDTETIKKHHVGANLLQDAIAASLRFSGIQTTDILSRASEY